MLYNAEPIIHGTALQDSVTIPFDDLYFNNKDNLLRKIFKKAQSSDKVVWIDKTKEAIHEENQLITVKNYLEEYKLLDRAVVLDTTQDETLYEKHSVKHIGAMFHVWNYILCYNHRKDMPHWTENVDYTFLCLNNWHKLHRYEIIHRLHKTGLIDKVKWSYRQKVSDSAFPTPHFIDQASFPKPDLEVSFDQNANLIELYGNSFCSIANETDFYNKGITHVTEKSLLAYYYGTVPIVVGVTNSLGLLREHGIDTFDDIIDNEYDTETDNELRLQKIMQSIKKVYKLENLHDLKGQLRGRIRANQRLLVNVDHWLSYYKNKILTFNNF